MHGYESSSPTTGRSTFCGTMFSGARQSAYADRVDAADWLSADLNAWVRHPRPGIIINDRSGIAEDFGTPEQQ